MRTIIVLCLLVVISVVIDCGRRKNPLEPEFVNLIEPGVDQVVVVTKPSFSWDRVTYAYRYELQIDNLNTFYSPIIDDSSITSNSYISSISLSDRDYWWRVRTRQKYSGWEVWSEVRKFTVAVGKPVPLSPVNDTVDSNQPTFTWNAIPNALKYEIQVDNHNTFYSPIIDDSMITGPSYVPDTVIIDGDYHWRVRVEMDDNEWSDWSVIASFSIDTNPFRIVASFPTKGFARDVVVRDDTAYVAQGEGGFVIIDITDEENPFFVGECSAKGNAQAIAIRDSFAYLAVGKDGVSTILFGDPENPVHQSLAAGGDDNAVDIVYYSPEDDTMSYLFAAENDEGMWILEIYPGYPGNPLPFIIFDIPGYENGLFLDSTYLYVGCGELGLAIVDVSKITMPNIIGTCDTRGYAKGLFVKDTLVYLTDGSQGLDIINAADKSIPNLVGNFDTEDDAKSVFMKGDTAFVADENKGMVVLDVSDPLSPRYLGGVETEYADAIWVEDDYAVIADRYEGIVIVKWDVAK